MHYNVQLTNRPDITLEVQPEETILEAAERQGVVLLAGCRVGACRTCAAKLTAGRVSMPAGTALDDRLVKAGVVLTCVATVSGDSTLEVAAPGRPMLHKRWLRPWTD